MDYGNPVEALIPGVQGRVLTVLARTEAELTMRSVAELADVSANQATVVLNRLVRLGLVERRDVGAAALVRLVRENEAARSVLSLLNLRQGVLARLAGEARKIRPVPTCLAVFGSFARGEADENSDVDVLVVPPLAAQENGVQWTAALGHWSDRAARIAGNPVNLLEATVKELTGLVRRQREPWRTIVEEGVVLIGTFPSELQVVSDGSRATMVDGTGTTTYGYDAAGDQTSAAFVAGGGTGLTSYTVSHTYYSNGDLDTVVYPATTATSTPTATYKYDQAGNMASVTDWSSNTTTFTHDPDANLTESSLAGTTNVTSTFDLGDVPTAITAKVGATTLASFGYTRQAAELVGSETDTGTPGTPSPSAQSYTYDNATRVTNTGTATATYNSDDDPTSLPGVPDQAFNAADQVCWSGATSASCGSPPTGATTYSYNTDGDRVIETPPAATGAAYGYNQADELTSAAPVVPEGRLADGASHSLAVRSDGSVWAFGANADGQLGNGTTTASTTPLEVPSLSGVIQVAAGSNTSYALTSSGAVDAWGYGANGELGNGATSNSTSPVSVSGLSGITAIAAGADHGLALTSTGTVEAWGLGTSGQLGNGTTSSSDTPVAVSSLTGVVAIAAGLNTSYALTSSGAVYAWGFGTNGELGNGTTSSSDTPVAVSGLSGITAIAGGGDHGLALTSSGTVEAWGLGTSGQLGNGTTTSSDTPVAVSSLTGITAIAAAQDSSYARGATGAMSAWGLNNDGQLANGTTTNADTAGSVSGITASALSASPAGQATLVEQADGSVYGFGLDSSSQLGNNSTFNALNPTPVLNTQNRVADGAAHSLAVRSDGSVWAFGANADGQLGNGTTTSAGAPVEVLSGATQVAAGSNTSYALTASGTVKAWGYGANGELGNGATSNSTSPVSVSSLTGITAIAAGADHGLALTSTGTVEAWGLGTSGQLGNGTTTSSDTPVAVSSLTGVVAIAAGLNTSYALTSSGAVYAWGAGTNGELGNGGTTSSDTAVAVSGISTATAIAGGGNHGLALLASGAVKAWGLGTSGQLGNGGTTSSDTPVSVSSLTNITAISAAQDSSYARTSSGVVYSWGLNNDGQLANGTTTNADTAGSISGVTAAALSASPAGQASFVEQADGSVYGFGLDTSSQLGNNGTTNAEAPTLVLNLAPATSTQVSTYTYSGDGVRMSTDTPAGLSTFAWDTTPSNPEVLSDGIYSYLYGPSGEVVEQVSQGGTATFLVQDQIGSTRLLVNSSGTVVGSETYGPYGAVAGESGSSSTAIGFAGGYEDGTTGFVYLIHRYYDPGTGEFLTVDPLVTATGQPYSYGGDMPTDMKDPNGENPARVVAWINLRAGTTTPLRAGGPGYNFGWWKINHKHNIWFTDIIQTTAYHGSRGVDGNIYTYAEYFQNEYDANDVVAIQEGNNQNISTSGVLKGLEIGITTAFCQGYYGQCPEWVATAGIIPLGPAPIIPYGG